MKTLLTLYCLLAMLPFSSFGQAPIIPIVELKFRGLMGGVQNGKWVAPTRFRDRLKAETEFVLVGRNGVEEGGVTLGKKAEQEDVCQDFTRFEFELEQDHGVAIGSSAKWNPMPRMPKAIDLNNATYKTVIATFLKKKGIARKKLDLR